MEDDKARKIRHGLNMNKIQRIISSWKYWTEERKRKHLRVSDYKDQLNWRFFTDFLY